MNNELIIALVIIVSIILVVKTIQHLLQVDNSEKEPEKTLEQTSIEYRLSSIEVQYDVFESLFSKMSDEGHWSGLILCLHTLGMDETLPFIKLKDNPSALSKMFVDSILWRINDEEAITPHFDNSLFEFRDQLRDLVMDSFKMMLLETDEIILSVLQYKEKLLSLKRSNLRNNEWGDLDDTQWLEVLTEFAKDKKLLGLTQQEQNSFETTANKFLTEYKLNHLPARFLDSVLSLSPESDEIEKPSPVTGEDFEHHIKTLIEDKFPNICVNTTPRTGDHGADLLVYTNKITIAIQAKYYTGNVGNAAVQEIYSAKDYYDADVAIVVTNSEYTSAARDAANKLDVLLAYDSNIAEIIEHLIG